MNRVDDKSARQGEAIIAKEESSVTGSRFPAPSPDDQRMTLGHLLVRMGKLTSVQVDRVLNWQAFHDCTFGEATVAMGLVSQADIMTALARQYHYPILRDDASSLGDLSGELVTGHDLFGWAAEAIRSIRSGIVHACLSRGTRSILIISARWGTGCT